MAVATPTALPRWDMSSIFPSLSSSEFEAAFVHVSKGLGELERLFNERGIDRGGSPAAIDQELFERAVSSLNALMEETSTLRSYVHGFTTTDSRDERASARASELDPLLSGLGKLTKRLIAWLGSAELDPLLASSQVARDHEFFLRRAEIGAAHQMEPALESLTSDLEITGSVAWKRLYANVTSQIMVGVELGGDRRAMPMSAVRALAADPDRTTRRAAYEAELEAWKATEVPIAAALNSVKGETLTLSGQRGWDSPLDAAIFSAHIDRETLDVMMEAAHRAFPDFRRYLHIKARALGLERLAWFDLFAPLPGSSKFWDYAEAERFIQEQFGSYSSKLGEFASRAMRERWIDAEPRPGKVDGAFCMPVRRDESRVLLNYKPSFDSVSTFAHELGHGYHNLCLDGRTQLQQMTPMTLAETASIFCETIVRNAVLRSGTDAQKLEALQGSLQGACQVVVDITSRFLFEQAVFEQRGKRELSSSEFCGLMLQAQRDTYGDGLDQDLLHPYMWAAKSHYYGRSFYNFPYMFGLLFGLGLFRVCEQEGEPFKARYDDLLSSTGLADAATLAARFGIDLHSPAFWEGSFDTIRADVELFERLVS